MATAITPISTYVTTGAVNTVVFSSIPGTYRDLMLVIRGSLTSATSIISFKSGTTTIWRTSLTALGAGSTPSPSTGASQQYYSQTSSTPTDFALEAHIYDYAQTNKSKPMNMYDMGGTSYSSVSIGYWDSTSAITSLTIMSYGGSTLAAGTKIDIYGVTA